MPAWLHFISLCQDAPGSCHLRPCRPLRNIPAFKSSWIALDISSDRTIIGAWWMRFLLRFHSDSKVVAANNGCASRVILSSIVIGEMKYGRFMRLRCKFQRFAPLAQAPVRHLPDREHDSTRDGFTACATTRAILEKNAHANSIDHSFFPKMIARFRLQQEVVENFLVAEVPCCDRGIAQGSKQIRV
jgi:hypothetical protein